MSKGNRVSGLLVAAWPAAPAAIAAAMPTTAMTVATTSATVIQTKGPTAARRQRPRSEK